jgi:peptidoglycan/xylan/chitin deacetylase (PgdA/CDA1 family)
MGSIGQRERRSCARLAVCLLVIVIGLGIASCTAPASGSRAAAPATNLNSGAGSITSRAITPMPTPSAIPTASPSPRSSATHTPQPTVTSTDTPQPTMTPTCTPAPAATPGPTPDGTARKVRAPILMYHYISEPPANADIYRKDLSVSPQQFESHLRYLKENGYQVITLDDLLGSLTSGKPLPPKPVILTFDDGYVDNYTNAFPLLQKYGMVGHFFIITDFVNEKRTEYMTWLQIEAMSAAGQRFGSHSRDHPDLKGKPVDYLVWQALGGMEAIQKHLGYHPRWISYPSGSYDAQTIAVYKSANYWGGLSTEQGATHTLDRIFDLKRVRVRGSHTASDLAMLLEMDW